MRRNSNARHGSARQRPKRNKKRRSTTEQVAHEDATEVGQSATGEVTGGVTVEVGEPAWKQIKVTEHAIDRFLDRTREFISGRAEVAGKIKRCVMLGRRSDREPELLAEYLPWLKTAKWFHRGRKVVLFVHEESRLCCMVVPCRHVAGRLVVLTSFFAREDSITHNWDGRHDAAYQSLIEQIKKDAAC